jgi:hypothetical protein
METPNQPNGQYLPKHSHFDPFKRVEHAQTYQVVLVLPTNQPTKKAGNLRSFFRLYTWG